MLKNNKEDEVDELYDKIREVEEDLVAMRHTPSLMKIYVKKLKEMDDNITLADIMNDSYKKYLNVIKKEWFWYNI